ncbi:MAG TPA: SH3 domain-containing protein [Candidatus Limnocylindrales bacterium]|nr:SH3 domain-containing protein [Candidatus Limnocylindrales bacterium]
MACAPSVAQRAASRLRRTIPVIAALVIAATAIATTAATPAQAAYAPRVVIVVGPSGGATSDYLGHARSYAAQAKAYGASVTTVFTPRATWPRVLAAAQGANIFIYMGHGNGWPSRYAPYQDRTKNGLGLNPWDGSGNTKVKYYGEAFIAAQIRLAPGAVVLLNRLCYASGNAEPGMAEPTVSAAVKRVDNYAAGFLRAGATTVIADGHTSLVYELAMLFGRSRPVHQVWGTDPDFNGNARVHKSVRSPGYIVRLDPDRPRSGFYRSVVSRAGATTGTIRIAALTGTIRVKATLRAGPGTGARSLGTVARGAKVVVRGLPAVDGEGRTWVPVMTRSGTAAYVAGWIVGFSGTARPGSNAVLRTAASTGAGRKAVIKAGDRVTVTGSAKDGRERAWLKVRTSSGRTGWIAAWLMQP